MQNLPTVEVRLRCQRDQTPFQEHLKERDVQSQRQTEAHTTLTESSRLDRASKQLRVLPGRMPRSCHVNHHSLDPDVIYGIMTEELQQYMEYDTYQRLTAFLLLVLPPSSISLVSLHLKTQRWNLILRGKRV